MSVQRLYTRYTPPRGDARPLRAGRRGARTRARRRSGRPCSIRALKQPGLEPRRAGADPLRAGRSVAAAGRRPAGDRGAGPAPEERERLDPATAVGALAAARPAGGRPRRAVPRHRVPDQGAEAGRARPRLPGHRPRPLRARALLPPGRRHRHRPRAHHARRPRRSTRPAIDATSRWCIRCPASRWRRRDGWTRRWRRCGRPSGWR